MTTKEILQKYFYIVERVRKNDFPSLVQIQDYVNFHMGDHQTPIVFSDRTFLRAKNDIAELYDLDITYSKASRGYYISYERASNEQLRALEAINVFLTLKEAAQKDLKGFIIPDNRCQLGTEHLMELLNAIRNRRHVQFAYSKYYNDTTSFRNVASYTIKESQGRWYLIGKDLDDGIIKVFGLDRISGLTCLDKQFNIDPNFNSENFFKHRFGVNASCEYGNVESIVLQFSPLESKYILSKPIHPTQTIIKQTEEFLQVCVEVYPSHDFIMELLSFGPNVKVTAPQHIVDQISKMLKAALEQYSQS